jgi:hypothetical protein
MDALSIRGTKTSFRTSALNSSVLGERGNGRARPFILKFNKTDWHPVRLEYVMLAYPDPRVIIVPLLPEGYPIEKQGNCERRWTLKQKSFWHFYLNEVEKPC